MAPQSKTVPGVELVWIIMPAISPIYGQNPGYGLLQIDTSDYTIQEMSFRFF